jgi:PelA/Pel-15E family pectate lyase
VRPGGAAGVAAALTLGIAGCRHATPAAPRPAADVQAASARALDSIRHLPGYRPAHDTIPLLSAARIDSLPEAERAAWRAYVARSEATHARDTALMNAELRGAGRRRMTRAPYVHDFEVTKAMTPAWFAGEAARHEADVILSFQAPNGGWSKHVDFTGAARAAGQSYYGESEEWGWISTFDNSSTTEEIRFLALADAARSDARYQAAARRGIDYVLEAQMPNGCFPQSYPLEGSYHDAITFNDGVTVDALRVLRDAAAGTWAFVPADRRALAATAVERGVRCLTNTQVAAGSTLTAWGQQHDPLTLRPTSARSYELTSLTGLESAPVMDFLMQTPEPSPRVIAAVHAAAAWYRTVAIRDFAYDTSQTLRAAPGAGPMWARLYELGTNRPIFSNREGITLYDWNQLTDRRRGYGWFTVEPASTLRRYEKWARTHPMPDTVQGP